MNSYKRKWWKCTSGNQEIWSSRKLEELKTVSRGGKESDSGQMIGKPQTTSVGWIQWVKVSYLKKIFYYEFVQSSWARNGILHGKFLLNKSDFESNEQEKHPDKSLKPYYREWQIQHGRIAKSTRNALRPMWGSLLKEDQKGYWWLQYPPIQTHSRIINTVYQKFWHRALHPRLQKSSSLSVWHIESTYKYLLNTCEIVAESSSDSEQTWWREGYTFYQKKKSLTRKRTVSKKM